MEFTGELI